MFQPPPEARIHVPWGPREVGLGLAIVIAAAAVLIVALSLAYKGAAPSWAVLGGTLVLDATLFGSAARLGPAGRIPIERLFGPVRLPSVKMWAWAGLALAASIGAGALYVTIASRFSDSLSPSPLPIEVPATGLRWLAFAIIVVIGPLSEEVFFRGFVFAGLLQRFGPPIAVIGSAALFAFAHLNVAVAGPAFLSGCIFAMVYRRSGSLWPLILAHTAQNAIAFSLAH